jgi:hypothetical protein
MYARLVAVKLPHTLVWAFFAASACIVGIPIAAVLHQFRWAAILTALVTLECAVPALNRGRCPLTAIAGRYTSDRHDNFDIYLPLDPSSPATTNRSSARSSSSPETWPSYHRLFGFVALPN